MIEEFGVSRTVVREAIANLKASGLVSTQQGKGAFVLDEGVRSFRISEENLSVVEEVLEALEVRIAIESEAAALAARRGTPELTCGDRRAACEAMDRAIGAGEATVDLDIAFHRAIAQATGNRHFLGLFNYLGEVLVPRARRVRPHRSTTPRRCRTTCGASAASITRSSMRSPRATATRRERRSGCISAAAATGSRRARAPAPELSVTIDANNAASRRSLGVRGRMAASGRCWLETGEARQGYS